MTFVAALLLAIAAPGEAGSDAASADPRAVIAAALDERRADEALRIELVSYDVRRRGCTVEAAQALADVEGSGVVPIEVSGSDGAGRPCSAAASATITVRAPAVRVKNAVERGAPVTAVEVELVDAEVSGRHAQPPRYLRELPGTARAARSLPRGTLLRAADLDVGPRLGDSVVVVVRSGALTVAQAGRVAACPGRKRDGAEPSRACASLKGGRRVAGVIDATNGALVVELRR